MNKEFRELYLRCYACDELLTENELDMVDIFDSMCEECFVQSQDDDPTKLVQDVDILEEDQ